MTGKALGRRFLRAMLMDLDCAPWCITCAAKKCVKGCRRSVVAGDIHE